MLKHQNDIHSLTMALAGNFRISQEWMSISGISVFPDQRVPSGEVILSILVASKQRVPNISILKHIDPNPLTDDSRTDHDAVVAMTIQPEVDFCFL